MVTLIFDQKATYLGELVTKSGALRHLVLTQAGEHVIGGYVSHWQTRGVPVFKGITKHGDDGANEFVSYREYISARDAAFLKAVHEWVVTHGSQAYDIGESILSMWERLLRLPLEPGERFRFLLAMMRTPAEQMSAWNELLEAGEKAYQVEHTKTQDAITKLKATASKHLLNAFEKEQTKV